VLSVLRVDAIFAAVSLRVQPGDVKCQRQISNAGGAVRTDRYTKVVLTIIALCLVWIAAGGPSLVTPVDAQNGTQRVVIVGWASSKYSPVNDDKSLPLPTTQR
jgi:hypothetical protein